MIRIPRIETWSSNDYRKLETPRVRSWTFIWSNLKGYTAGQEVKKQVTNW